MEGQVTFAVTGDHLVKVCHIVMWPMFAIAMLVSLTTLIILFAGEPDIADGITFWLMNRPHQIEVTP